MIQLDEVKTLLTQADEHTLSIYVTTDNSVQENQSTNPAWRTFVKDALRELDGDEGKGETGIWPTVRDRAEIFFRDYEPSGKGLAAIFTATDQYTFELPMHVDRYAAFDKPNVLPLLWAIDEYEPYIISMVDTEKAYFLVAYLGTARFQPEATIHIDFGAEHFGSKDGRVAHQTGDYVTRGSPVDEFQDFVDEHVAQLYRKVAEEIPQLMEKYKARRLILAGSEQSTHGVQKYLPKAVADQVVALKAIPMRYKPHEILAEVQADALAFERKDEEQLVQDVIDFAKSGGRGAIGWTAVHKALEMRQVELLILPWPVPDDSQATDLTLRTFASGGSVELVHDDAAGSLGGAGGVAARLYYAL
jgi:hypothetical protein